MPADKPLPDERRRFLESIAALARALRDQTSPEFGSLDADLAIEHFVHRRFAEALECGDKLLMGPEQIAEEWAPFVGVLRMHCLRHDRRILQ